MESYKQSLFDAGASYAELYDKYHKFRKIGICRDCAAWEPSVEREEAEVGHCEESAHLEFFDHFCAKFRGV